MAQLKLRNPFEETPAAPPGESTFVRRPTDGEPADSAQLSGDGAGEEARQPTIRLSVDLERPLHRRLRRWALERDQTASDVIRELLTSALDGAGY